LTVTAWRIVKSKYTDQAFTGEAARLLGGRWNSEGTRAIYIASSVSLAILEILVHLDTTHLLEAYSLFEVSFDESLVEVLDPATLPNNWRLHPPPYETQTIGDRWITRASSAILKVPSVIVPTEPNYILNPLHPEFGRITISAPLPLPLDARLLGHRHP